MKEIPAYSPRWLSRFFSFLRHLPIPLWIVALAVIFIIGLALHLDAWRRGLLPSGSVAMELAAEGFWLTFLPGLWLYLDRSAGRAIEGFFAEQNKTAPEMEMIVADFLSLPAVAAAGVFLLGVLFGILAYLSAVEASPIIESVAWESVPNFSLTSGLMALILFRSIRQAVLMGRYFAAAKVDLFNPQPIFALSRYSSQSSLAIIVMFYLLFLLSTSSEWETFQEGLLSPIFVTIQFVLIGVGIFLFFMSLGSINRHMRMEKDRLLTMFGKNLEVIYVKTTVAAEKEQFEKVKGFRDAAATMKEGWELVKKLPTWPWEAESLRNMLSPLLIPILVFIIQRFIGSFLGS